MCCALSSRFTFPYHIFVRICCSVPKKLELDNITKKVSHSKLTSFRQILQIVIDTAQDKSIFSHFEVVERDLP